MHVKLRITLIDWSDGCLVVFVFYYAHMCEHTLRANCFYVRLYTELSSLVFTFRRLLCLFLSGDHLINSWHSILMLNAGLQTSVFIFSSLCWECPNKASFPGIYRRDSYESLPCSAILFAPKFCTFCLACHYSVHHILDLAIGVCQKLWRSSKIIF